MNTNVIFRALAKEEKEDSGGGEQPASQPGRRGCNYRYFPSCSVPHAERKKNTNSRTCCGVVDLKIARIVDAYRRKREIANVDEKCFSCITINCALLCNAASTQV